MFSNLNLKMNIYEICEPLAFPAHHPAADDNEMGKSSESVQCAMLKACDACADMGQL